MIYEAAACRETQRSGGAVKRLHQSGNVQHLQSFWFHLLVMWEDLKFLLSHARVWEIRASPSCSPLLITHVIAHTYSLLSLVSAVSTPSAVEACY